MAGLHLRAGFLALALSAAGAALAGPAVAAETAAPETPSAFSQKAALSRAVVSTYPMPRTLPTGGAGALVVDHSGNAWFNETIEEPPEFPGGTARHPNMIARMNRAGEVTLITKGLPGQLAVAPDNSIWFTGFDKVVRIAPDGNVASFPLPEEGETSSGSLYRVIDEDAIVVGPEGDAWFGANRHPLNEEGKAVGSEPLIARMTPSGELSEFVLPEAGGQQIRLAVGPEGNIWFTAPGVNRIGYVTPAGRIEEFPSLALYSSPNYLTAGPNGSVWFSMYEKGPVIAQVNTSGALSGFRLGGEKEYVGDGSMVTGPDGRVWFAAETGVIGRIDPDGRLSKITLPNHTYPQELAVGPEGEVWYSSAAEAPCQTGDTACGGGGYYTSGIIGRIAPAPLSVELPKTAKPAKGGRQIKLRIGCIDGAASATCKGKLRIRAAGTGNARTFSLGTDSGRAFSVALPSQAQEKLRRRHQLAVSFEAVLAGARPMARRYLLHLPASKKGA